MKAYAESRWARRVAMLAVWALAAGCQRGGGGAGGMEHLRLSSYASNPAETGLMRQLIAEFNQAHPGIHVTYEPVPGQYYPKILTMLVSKTAPDVFYLDVAYFQPLLSKGVLRPLDDFLARSSTRLADFIPSLVQGFRHGSTTYGIPKDFNAYGLFYNRAMFDAAHLPYPDATWDLERLRAAAKALTRRDGEPHYGFGLTLDADRYLPIAKTYGASLFDANGKCGLTSPEAIAAMAYYSGLKLVDHAAIYPSEIGSSWTGDAFGRQSVAMAFEGGWLVPYLQESFPEVRYGVTELPKGPKGRSNFLFTVAYVIPKDCKHPEAAWKLIEFLTSADAQRRVTYALPSRKAVSARYVQQHPEYRPILAGAAYGMPFEFGPKGDRIRDRLGGAVQEVFLGGTSPEQALTEACDEIDRIARL